jgi:speckle-type POZ protein
MATRCRSSGFIEIKVDFAGSISRPAIDHTVRSDDFSAGGHIWSVEFHLTGDTTGNGVYFSLSLQLVNESKSKSVKAITDAFLLGRGGTPSSSHGKRWVHVYPTPDGSPSSRNYLKFVKRSVLESGYYVTDGYITFMVGVIVLGVGDSPIPVPSSDIADHLGHLLDHADSSNDVTFSVGLKTFGAHRAVLAARSPVFKAQLFGSMADAEMRCITLHGIRPETFRILLRFIYTDALTAGDDCDGDEMQSSSDIDLFQDLLAAADMYQLDRLKLMCARKLWGCVSVETVAKILGCAELYNCSELKSECLDFFLLEKNFKIAVLTDGWFQLMQSFPSVVDEIRARVPQT